MMFCKIRTVCLVASTTHQNILRIPAAHGLDWTTAPRPLTVSSTMMQRSVFCPSPEPYPNWTDHIRGPSPSP